MRYLVQIVITLILIAQQITNLEAQAIQLTDEQEQQIDALFEPWNKNNSPGVSVGILSGNTPIYLKGYGQDKIDCGQPIHSNTPFRIGGMAQHFTAFAILFLEEQGKLSLDDDIRKYLPDFPKRKNVIKIKHLLTHSSGLPAYWSLKDLAGYNLADNFSDKESYELLKQNWELKHRVGQKYIFKGTGSVLLAQIVKNITGQPLNDFMQKEILNPLGMEHSFFVDGDTYHLEIANAHTRIDEKFVARTINHNAVGAAGYITTMSDMMKWYQNIQNPKVGSKKMMQKLDSVAKLENGTETGNYNGKMTYGQQFMHLERGINKIWDYGALGGYASSIFRFPAYDLTIVVFSNTGMTYNGFLGMQSAEILLKDKFTKEEITTSKEKPSYTKLSKSIMEAFEGDYFDPSTYTQRVITVKNDTLRYIRPNYNTESPLIPISKNKLHMPHPNEHIILDLNEKVLTVNVGEERYPYKKYQKVNYTIKELSQFTGDYYCRALKTVFELKLEDEILTAKRPKSKAISLNPFQKDRFLGNSAGLNHLQFTRNSKGEIIGFTVSSNSIQKVYFEKI